MQALLPFPALPPDHPGVLAHRLWVEGNRRRLHAGCFDLFVDIGEFACFCELTKSGVIPIQRFTFLLLCLSKVVHFIGAVDLWSEILVQFRDCCVIIVVSPGVW